MRISDGGIVIPSIPSNVPSDVSAAPPVDRFATGSFGSRVKGVTVASGYDLPFGPLILTPIVRFLYQHTGVNAFSEEGAMGADLQYGSSSVNTVSLPRRRRPIHDGYTVPRPLSDRSVPLGASIQSRQYRRVGRICQWSEPAFDFHFAGNGCRRTISILGSGSRSQLSGNQSAFVNYDFILGISHTSYNSFTAGYRMNF